MTNKSEIQIGRITAILTATEDVVERAKVSGDRFSVMMAKETAYDHIKGVVEESGYCPWQE